MKLEITKEAFYLHEALKVIQESGFKNIYVGFDKNGMNILIYEYAKSQTYIRNITANSIQASLMELKDIYTGEFKEEKSNWSKVEPDFKYVKLEEVLEGPFYTAWGKKLFKKETIDGYSIERKWEFKMFIEDLNEENKEFFIKELKEYYPKRMVDIEKLFIKVTKINKLSIHRLEKLRQQTNNPRAFLFIENNEAELYTL